MPAFTSSSFGNYTSKWLVATSIFEILLAVGFFVVGFKVPGAAWSMYLTGGILGVVGIGLLIIGLRVGAATADSARVSRAGVPGSAQVTALTQTGMFLNDNPQVKMDLLVHVTGKPPYVASRKEFIPLIMLSRISPGSMLPVKVDPSNPNDVVVQWDQPASAGAADASETLGQVASELAGTRLAAAAPFTSADQSSYTVEQLRAYIRASGLEGTATINELTDSGHDVGNDRLMTMQATVNIPGSPPLETPQTAAMIPIGVVGKVMVGSTVPVKVSPENHNAIVVEWDRL